MKGSRQGQGRTDSASRIRHTLDSLLSTEGVDSESTGEGARFGRHPRGKMMTMVLTMIDVCVHVCRHACACVYMGAHVCFCMCVDMHLLVYMCLPVCFCMCADMHLLVYTCVCLHVSRHALACVYIVCAGHAHNLEHDVPVPLCNHYNNNIIIIRLQCAFMQVFLKEFLTLQGWKSGSLLWAPFTV